MDGNQPEAGGDRTGDGASRIAAVQHANRGDMTGALAYYECMGEDVKPGKWTSFPQSVKLEPGEVVWFSWIVFKSRKHRDTVNAKVMKDERFAGMGPDQAPFDGKRMIYGGFTVEVEL